MISAFDEEIDAPRLILPRSVEAITDTRLLDEILPADSHYATVVADDDPDLATS